MVAVTVVMAARYLNLNLFIRFGRFGKSANENRYVLKELCTLVTLINVGGLMPRRGHHFCHVVSKGALISRRVP